MPATLDPAREADVKALARLDTELIAWLTTVNPDGQPQASPIWFLWDGSEILLYSWSRAPRNGNIPGHPLVAFNLEAGKDGEEVVTAECEARIVPDEPPASANPRYVAKYQGMFDSYGWTPEWFSNRYAVPIRLRPMRWRL